jgi:hypothetical protein
MERKGSKLSNLDQEQERWQEAIRNLLIDLTGNQDIDGSGCDSGDPLDVTLDEIRQAFEPEVFESVSTKIVKGFDEFSFDIASGKHDEVVFSRQWKCDQCGKSVGLGESHDCVAGA